MARPRILFVTGKLAEPSLRRVLEQPGIAQSIDAHIAVLPITVAALLQVRWISRKLTIPDGIERVILPGWCQGDLQQLSRQYGVPFERGPKDVFDLPAYLGRGSKEPPDLTPYSIDILAEINHAPGLEDAELVAMAIELGRDGADLIDLGCIPGERWQGIGAAVRRLREAGLRVSVDSFDRDEVEDAVAAGAELVLSCSAENVAWAADVPAEFVVIPTVPDRLETLDEASAYLAARSHPFRLDPILEPIGYGFTESLRRYYQTREQHPDAAMMMGIGNVTELTEVDSAGVNFLLAAFCQELRIGSVLTTQVINWCRTSVREFDEARRLVHYAARERALPKHLGAQLVTLRDPRLTVRGDDELNLLASQIRDPNFRIFAERGAIHVMNRDGYWQGQDPYELFDQMSAQANLSAQHAFYLGMELHKARTALTLGKNYVQDEALRWGFLTVDETSALERRRDHRSADSPDAGSPDDLK
ncbi:MAG: dihydropteroate synthase [Planctomycetaceae bacterium]|nr:dihydropteroate synthase [Planctomycetaceae bacterium]